MPKIILNVTEEVTTYRDHSHTVHVSEDVYNTLSGYMGREYKHQDDLLDFYFDLRRSKYGEIIETKIKTSDFIREPDVTYTDIHMYPHEDDGHPTLW